MVADYTDQEAVLTLLRSSPSAGLSTDDVDRIEMLIPFVSLEITRRAGVEFGIEPSATSIMVPDVSGPTMFLPMRIRSVTGIVENPDWIDDDWTNGYVVDPDYYRVGSYSIHGTTNILHRQGGYWNGNYVVTGLWANQPEAVEIPADITYIATYITAELYKKQAANPAGFQGPDGYTVAIRNAFKEPEVRSVLYAYAYDPFVFVV